MELKVKNITFPEVIEFNFEELKKEVTEKSAMYLNLVYTDNQISEAKKDRSQLNKFVKALSDERIKIKKQCLHPYEDFERKINELTGIVNESIKNIDGQVKGYEEQKRQEKLDEITNLFNSTDHPEWLHLSQIFDDRWLNASVSMKAVLTSIDSRIDKIENDLASLQNLKEFSFEAIEVYMSTLDLNRAIQEGKRLADIQMRKAEAERQAAERRAEQERLKAEAEEARKAEEFKKQCEADDAADIQKKIEEAGEPEKQWIAFKALLSTEDALALKEFFNSRQIEFKAV